MALGALVAALAGPARAWPAEPNPLLGPTQCVSDYLEALAAAAPPRPRGRSASPPSTGAEARWSRVRAHLAPSDGGPRLAPWAELGPEGAFLGYELVRARRAPRGAAVFTALARTIRTPGASPVTSACAYLTARMGGEWLIADRRCGGDFADAEVLAMDARGWDAPDPAPAAATDPDELLPDDPE